MRKMTLLSLLMLVPCLVSGRLLAQVSSQVTAAYAQAAKANAALLRHYTFQMRVALTAKSNAQPPKLYQMNFDPNGKLQKTLLSAPSAGPSGGPVLNRMEQRKSDEFKQWAGQLVDLVKQYMTPTPGKMSDFFSRAHILSSSQDAVAYLTSSFLQPGDTVTIWINPRTRAMTHYSFNTMLQEDMVQGQVQFAQVPSGPRYPSQLTVNVPSKQVNVVVTTFNFVKQ